MRPTARRPHVRWRFRWRIVLPVAFVTVMAAVIAGIGLFWAAGQSDAVSVQRQIRTTKHAIESSIDELAHQQEAVAIRDDAVQELQKPIPDWLWIENNIAAWLHRVFGHDQVYILDERGRPLYAMIDGKRAQPTSFIKVYGDVYPLIEGVRGHSRTPPGRHDRHPGERASGSSVRTTAAAQHDSHMLRVQERPAAVSAMLFAPLSNAVRQPPGSHRIILSIKFLDGAFLNELSQTQLIAAPRFSMSKQALPGESMVPLHAEQGSLVGYFFWRPELPGTRIKQVILPAAALLVTLLGGVMSLLAASLYRSTRALRTTMAELTASEAQAQHLALHDPLTELPNRALFGRRLQEALGEERRAQLVAVLLLDLDRFKNVNDTLGHQAGDALIAQFAQRLSRLVRPSDTVARLGGDEFAVLVKGIRRRGDVSALCQRILHAVDEPFKLEEGHAVVGVSIGVATAISNARDPIELMRKADIALYEAKADGRGRFCFFSAQMDKAVRLRGQIEDELRDALTYDENLHTEFQPIVAATNTTIVGVEALARWQHPTRGEISPALFVPVAEESGLIVALGERVLREACTVSARWPHLFVAVNLSPTQIRTAGFVDRAIAVVSETGSEPSRIEFEITETLLLDADDAIRAALARLRAAGFRIALDDFGTGYSSLSHLRRFQVDKIKIDRSFVEHIGAKADSGAIVTAVTALGHAMGLCITAEGVETEEQRTFLVATGCDQLQGHLFSRSLPVAELERKLDESDEGRRAA